MAATALATSGGAALASSHTSAPAHQHASAAAAGSSTKAAPKQFFTESLSGSKRTRTFTAKGRWQLSYDYNCGGAKGSFTLVLRPAHGARVKVTSQSGLGGGGTRTYKAGRYSLSATTTCKWTITATTH